jgi:tripartite-type tricarboxylate transporter receptor subunit TctC
VSNFLNLEKGFFDMAYSVTDILFSARRATRATVLPAVAVAFAAAAFAPPAQAQSVEQFYAGKQGKLIIGGGTGGGYDFYGRLIGPFLTRHLPGAPNFIPTSMPGAGGITAANYLYNIAPKDGTEIGIVGRAVSTQPLISPKDKGPHYVATKFNWLGTPTQETGILLVRSAAKVKTIQDLKTQELVVSGTGASAPPSLYPRIMNNLFGTKFKVVTGYEGSQTALLAVERGEVDGHVASSATAPLRDRIAPWLQSGSVKVIAQIGLEKDPRNGDVPLIMELASSDLQRQVMELVLVQQVMAWPFLAPPDVPADRVAALRAAFDATMKDPEFLARAAKQQLDIDPVGGAQLNKLLDKIYASPKEVLDKVSELTEKR